MKQKPIGAVVCLLAVPHVYLSISAVKCPPTYLYHSLTNHCQRLWRYKRAADGSEDVENINQSINQFIDVMK